MSRLRVWTFAFALAGCASAYGSYHLGFVVWPPEGLGADGRAIAYRPGEMAACLKMRVLGLVGSRQAEVWQMCKVVLAHDSALPGLELRWDTMLGSGAFGLMALMAFAAVVRFEPRPARIIRGARLHSGKAGVKAFARACARECKQFGRGLGLLPPIALSRERETRHVLVLGSVGGGKTQTMLHLMSDPLVRGDGLLVLDTKGDMMAGLPGEPLLVAPHDARSLVWDIAADCRVKQDARELAARFIPTPPGADPIWSEAAQEIFVACIVHLQQTRQTEWGWHDLLETVTADVATLASYAKDHNPNALRLLAQPDSKTTLSILSTFQTHMRIVAMLAEAWRHGTDGRFSVRGWLHNPVPYRPLILQHEPSYPDLSRIWIGSLLGLLASAVGSPSLRESAGRRVWLFLDEFPQLPAIKQFPMFLELGRSKGICVVIGAQDMAQIKSVYGENQAKAWFGTTGTKIITRIHAGDTAEEISRTIGDQEVERTIRTHSRSTRHSGFSESLHREMRRVVTASELASRLGPHRKHGVRVLVMGLGADVYELDLPFITLAGRREPTVPALWTGDHRITTTGPRLSSAEAEAIRQGRNDSTEEN